MTREKGLTARVDEETWVLGLGLDLAAEAETGKRNRHGDGKMRFRKTRSLQRRTEASFWFV